MHTPSINTTDRGCHSENSLFLILYISQLALNIMVTLNGTEPWLIPQIKPAISRRYSQFAGSDMRRGNYKIETVVYNNYCKIVKLSLVILLFLWGLVILLNWWRTGGQRLLVETDWDKKAVALTFTTLTTRFAAALWWKTFVTDIHGEIWILIEAQISIVCLRHSYSCHTGDANPHPAGLTVHVCVERVTFNHWKKVTCQWFSIRPYKGHETKRCDQDCLRSLKPPGAFRF